MSLLGFLLGWKAGKTLPWGFQGLGVLPSLVVAACWPHTLCKCLRLSGPRFLPSIKWGGQLYLSDQGCVRERVYQ